MTRWWRSHSLRVQLTLWYVCAMVVVLGVYAAAVYTFVSRSVESLFDQRLRGDFQVAAAMVDRAPDGKITWGGDDSWTVDEDTPWLQVWSPGGELLYSNFVAEQLPLPASRFIASQPQDRSVSVPTGNVAYRILIRNGTVSCQP